MHSRIFLALAFSCSLSAYAEDASVSGTLNDSSGGVIYGGKISLHQLAGSALLATTSDRAGHFIFEHVSPGQYLLDASAPGLSLRDATTLRLSSGESKQVALELIVSAVTTQVSVTGAGAPQSVDEVSKALDVVDVSSAEQRGLFTVPDAVKFVPGLRVSTRGGPGSFTTIQTRGLRTTDTAVLIDGFPFRDPTSVQDEASAYIADLFLVDSSRIEVLRGSGSSLYGSNAMSGTVNIITDTSGGPVHGDLDLQGGGLGLFRGLAQMSGGALKNRLSYSAGISDLNVTDGVASAGAARDWSGQAGVTYALASNMRFGATVFANTGFLQTQLTPSPTPDAPTSGIIPATPATFITSLGDPDAGIYSHFVNSLFRFEHEVNSRLSYRIGYGIVDSERNNTNGPAGPATEYDFQPSFNTSDRFAGRIDTLQGRLNYLAGSNQILTAGYEFQRENYSEIATDPDTNTRTTARQQTNAVFAQDELHFLDGRWQVLLAGRFTRASLDQPAFVGGSSPYAAIALPSPPQAYTGDASVSYFLKRSSTKLRAHTGNSFRLPSVYERFGGYFYGGAYTPIGDPRLAPERAISLDFGFDQYLFRERLKLSGTYFYSHLQQVIGYLNFPPGYVDPFGRTAGYYDTKGSMARGVELSAEFRPTRKTTILTSYVYTNARDVVSQYYTGTAIDPVQTPRILPHDVKVTAMQQLGKRFDVAMDFEGGSSYLFPLFGYDQSFNYQPFAYRFQGPRQLGLSGGYTLNLNDRISTRLYVRVSNTLNQNYYEDGFETPGRWAVAGIRLGF